MDPSSTGIPPRPAGAAAGRTRRRLMCAAAAALAVPFAGRAGANVRPVRVGLDAEFGLENSTSAQAIELGLRVAIAEVNAAGGVLGGRPLELLTRDNRSMPARAAANLRELAAQPDLVAVFGGKFSPVMIEAVPLAHQLTLPLLAVWSSADPIVEHTYRPNYVFRLALRDSLAMPKLLDTAAARGLPRAGLLLANTGWGRSNLAAAQRHVATAARSTRGAQAEWPGFEVDYRHGSALYRITAVRGGPSGLQLDGRPLPGTVLPLRDDGAVHEVQLALPARRGS